VNAHRGGHHSGAKRVHYHHRNHGTHHRWSRRAYYGTAFIGAVTLGTIIAVTAPHVIPVVPGDNACWYWTDPSETHGYWDYCVIP
jgi:hypothetical protein